MRFPDNFFAVPVDATIWDTLNAPILVAIIAAVIGFHLNQRVKRTERKIEDQQADLKTAIRVSEELSDEALEAVEEEEEAVAIGEDFREEARLIAENARDFISEKIKNDTDQRHQRTYEKFSGHHPISRAIALSERGQITADQERALVTLLRIWRKYSKGRAANRPVPRAVYDLMRDSWDRAENG